MENRAYFGPVLILLSLLLGATTVQATTYTYTGNNFNDVTPPYTMANSVTGEFVVPGPLPTNAISLDISGLLTSYSFSDGLVTRTEANSLICTFSISTDAAGQLNGWAITLRTSPVPANGDPSHDISLISNIVGTTDSGGEFVSNALGCDQGFALPNDLTGGYGIIFDNPGSWASDAQLAAQAIPTLSNWAVILMIAAFMLMIMLKSSRVRQ